MLLRLRLKQKSARIVVLKLRRRPLSVQTVPVI